VTLKFDGEYLWMYGIRSVETSRYSAVLTGKPFKYHGVSGRPVGGSFDYSPERQRQRGEGPIPAGRYWITPSEIWEAGIINWIIRRTTAWGNFRISIHPYPDTATFGRGGFFIHGGSEPGSAGCIDLTDEMDKFIEDLRSGVRESSCHIPLTVAY
jgi:type VI secretion system (T6SS) effector TldE1-like protein